jgi:hypothetical protein
MLDRVGRISLFLLVLIIVGLAARVLFVDARAPDELEPKPAPHPTLPAPAPEPPPAPVITIVDPDPDLDQSAEPSDCQGAPEPPVEPKLPVEPEPELPAPH